MVRTFVVLINPTKMTQEFTLDSNDVEYQHPTLGTIHMSVGAKWRGYEEWDAEVTDVFCLILRIFNERRERQITIDYLARYGEEKAMQLVEKMDLFGWAEDTSEDATDVACMRYHEDR